MPKPIHHAPKFNADSKKWEVIVTDGGTGAHIETKPFDTKQDGLDWSMQQAISNVTGTAAAELTPKQKSKTKMTGSSKLSL